MTLSHIIPLYLPKSQGNIHILGQAAPPLPGYPACIVKLRCRRGLEGFEGFNSFGIAGWFRHPPFVS
jgi:hypothetical protein